MRGTNNPQASMLLAVPIERRIPATHPLRAIKAYAEACFAELEPKFEVMYSKGGRPSIPPERLLKSSLLMALYSIRSERLFCEQLEYNLLYRWFLDMDVNESAFNHSTFSHNRQRLLDNEVAKAFFGEVVGTAKQQGLVSDDHFTVDGTLIEAWASIKSFRPKDEDDNEPPPSDLGDTSVNFKGEKRSNKTHMSKTDPEARLARKGAGKEAKLSYAAHALMENRNGLLVDFEVTQATGHAERMAALSMLCFNSPLGKKSTVGADKGYDSADFVEGLRSIGVTPHVAQKKYSAIDGRTANQPGYIISQRKRKLIEESFGWMKTVGQWRKTRYVGLQMNRMHGYLMAAAYNLVRMSKLSPIVAS